MAIDFDTWLRQIGLAEYTDVFRRHAIGFDIVADLSEDDLRELDLPIGHRKRLLKAVLVLGEKTPVVAHSAQTKVEEPKISQASPRPAISGPPLRDVERRQAAILFADLTGYTSLSAELDPEELQDVMAEFFRVTDGAIEAHGGTVDKHLGDGVMAVFGAPISHGDDTLRAVRSAFDIHVGLRKVTLDLGRELSSHIGIASGEVLAGAGTNQYTVIGDAVNLASRLSDLAKAHETFLSDEVHAEVLHETLCDERAGIAIKGLEEPVTVWKVVGRRDEPLEKNVLPFVGREAERTQFNTTIEAIPDRGSGAAFIFRGEPGIGKTRLATECLDFAMSRGYQAHHVLVLDFGSATGTDPLRALFRSLLGLDETSADNLRYAAAEDLLKADGFEADDAAFINDLLGLPMSEEAEAFYRAIENTARNLRKANLLCRAMERRAIDQPQVLLIEDLHWADQVTKDLCASLVAQSSNCSSVVLMTSRIEGDPFDQTWRSGTGSTPIYTIDLRPLSERETQELATVAGVNQEEALAEEMEKAGGNPLFLEMMIRSSAGSRTEAPSGNLRSMVQARIDRLVPIDRKAIQAASIVGQRFELDLVQHLIDAPDYQPTGLLERSLVHPMGERYLFAHALVREGVYASVTRRNAQTMHLQAALWFEDRDLILRAEHLAKAGDDRAAGAYLAAAGALIGQLRFETAKQMLRKGISIARDSAEVYELNAMLGQVALQTADPEVATSSYCTALEHADTDEEVCAARLGLALSYRDRPDISPAQVEANLDEIDKRAKLLPQSDALIESLCMRSYMENLAARGKECLEAAIAATRLVTPQTALKRRLTTIECMAAANFQSGRMRTSLTFSEQLMQIANEENSNEKRLVAGYQISLLYFFLNRFEDGLNAAYEPIEQAERFGIYRAAVIANETAARIQLALGNLDKAEHYAQRSLFFAQETGMEARAAKAYIRLLEIAQLRNDSVVSDYIGLVLEHSGSPYIRPWALSAAARAMSDSDEADRLFREADAILGADSSTGQNHFHVRENQIAKGLAQKDWGAVELAALKLEEFTKPEPLPWTDFHIKRGRVIAMWGRGDEDDSFADHLVDLRRTRDETSIAIWLPGDRT